MPDQRTWDPQRHGNAAQWVALIIAGLIGILSICLTVHYHRAEADTITSDEHTKLLIAGILDPATKQINDNVATLSQKVGSLAERVSDIEGQLKRMKADVSEQARKQQEILALTQNPEGLLGMIRTQIQTAQAKTVALPTSQLSTTRKHYTYFRQRSPNIGRRLQQL